MFDKMRRFFALLMVAGASMFLVSANALASNHDPHHEEQDGCDHGATGKECKEDPSDKGKDCEVHGNHGGVNEDHCTTTTTGSGATVTTVPEVTTTTGSDVTTTTGSDVTTTTGSDVTTEAPRSINSPVEESLPATGAPSEALAGLGAGMLLFGTSLRRFIRFK